MGTWLERYTAGETERVWAEMVARGAAVRDDPAFLWDATAVARETMRRVRANAETVHRRLGDIGYAFIRPKAALVAPAARVAGQIRKVEAALGPLPLSLHAFYEIVGAIDFRQSWKQLVNIYAREKRREVPEVLYLGEANPLVVHPVRDILAALAKKPGATKLYFCFAPDEFHKANYSGGENYHLDLPDPAADVPILGMYGVEETFVQHLRECFRFGGFRGHIESEEDGDTSWKVPPRMTITRELAKGLLPL